jgi:hypothetical protein
LRLPPSPPAAKAKSFTAKAFAFFRTTQQKHAPFFYHTAKRNKARTENHPVFIHEEQYNEF